MPLEALHRTRDYKYTLLGTIEAGQAFTIEDFSDGVVRVIVAHCYSIDIGGVVKEYEVDDFAERFEAVQAGKMFPFDGGKLLSEIALDGLFVEGLTDKEGQKSNAIFKHRFPGYLHPN